MGTGSKMTSQMFPTEDMTFSEESKKNCEVTFSIFYPFNVDIFMAAYKKKSG